MRFGLVPDIDSRNGTANKDERLTNVLVESDEGVVLAALRPGLSTIASASGNGNGLVNFQQVLISVFGTTLGYGETPTTIDTVENGTFDFAQSPL